MVSKKKGAITLLGLLAILGAGTFTFEDINIGNTISSVVNNNEVNNYILDNYGVDIQKFKEGCQIGKYTDPYCDLVT